MLKLIIKHIELYVTLIGKLDAKVNKVVTRNKKESRC